MRVIIDPSMCGHHKDINSLNIYNQDIDLQFHGGIKFKVPYTYAHKWNVYCTLASVMSMFYGS